MRLFFESRRNVAAYHEPSETLSFYRRVGVVDHA